MAYSKLLVGGRQGESAVVKNESSRGVAISSDWSWQEEQDRVTIVALKSIVSMIDTQ